MATQSPLTQATLERLEFPKFLQFLASYCRSQSAKSQVLNYRPHSHLNGILRQQNRYNDAMQMLVAMYEIPSFAGIDILPLLKRGALGGTLFSGEELLVFADLLETTDELVHLFQQPEVREHYPHLRELTEPMTAFGHLSQHIRHCIAIDGTIPDHASEKLQTLRREQRQLSQQIHHILNRLIKTENQSLQEDFITERNGRFVIPVKREERSRFPGVVHDMSNSERTLFVEPTQTLALGNEFAELRLKERDEIRRILSDCSYMIHRHIEEIGQNQRIAIQLDIIFAIATWAVEYHAIIPQFGNEFRLHNARHPLLDAQFRKDPDKVLIPLRLALPEQTKTLVITGSNTGGKTVCLKTIGLLSLMAQSGFPIPADPESRCHCFNHIFADIGDEQSINANLSTFSAHMETMKQILYESQKGASLILLDEIGSGTDPVEGAALACAELVELAKRNALTFATTHLGTVKLYVHQQKNMLNASVRFNEKTLQPEYILDVGRPGASHAFHIAERLHLPKQVIAHAQSIMSKDQIKLEKILHDMETTHKEAESHKENLAQLKQDAAQKQQDLKAELESIRQERRTILNEAYAQAQAIIDNTRKQVENLQRQLHHCGATVTEQQNQAFKEARLALQEKQKRLTVGRQQTEQKGPKALDPASLEVGQMVHIPRLKNNGRILNLSSDRKTATIETDGLKFVIKTSDITAATKTGSTQNASVFVKKPTLQRQISQELNLIGKRVEEALPAVQHFISDAMLAGLDQVRIVHGHGTGRLRDAIHDELRRNKLVADYRLGIPHEDPGGNGVTLVTVAR